LIQDMGMDAVQMRAGEDLGPTSAELLPVGKERASLGPAKPIVRALGLGFALGLLAMTVLTLVSH
jgi:hypothetical protein